MHFGKDWARSKKSLLTTNYGKRHLAQQVEPQPLSKMAVLLSHAAVQVGLPAYHVWLDQKCRLFARQAQCCSMLMVPVSHNMEPTSRKAIMGDAL